MATKKKPKTYLVTAEPKARKSNPSATKFQVGNERRFEKGVSSNPGGKPKGETRLLSKAMRVQLSWKAPDQVCASLELPKNSSWAQCLSMRMIRSAIAHADASAVRLLLESTEGVRQRFEIFGDDDNPEGGSVMEIIFVSSDGDGRPAPGTIIDAKAASSTPKLPVTTD